MKKIININLSGRVLPMEDSAYEKLQDYIESLRRYFINEEGRDEIINDIESRIAELLHDKIRKGADAIMDADIEEVISSMGRVEDFEAADKENNDGENASSSQKTSDEKYTYPKREKGRLYRDTNDKFIGGVCSGIAAYMNVDPAIVRILFAIITFGGFGLGFLAYIILWIVLPPKDLDGFIGKRLYRNPDDRIIGGVAGGLGAYFGRSPRTIRLIFAAPLILSALIGILNGISFHREFDLAINIGFGSLSGTFILAYIILWIVLPEANSDYEKMEMRGEKVDVNRIRQNVQEGMSNVKDRMKTWSSEVRESAQNFGNRAREFSSTTGKAFTSEVNETFRRRGSGIGHAFGVIVKAFFLFIAGTIAFALFVSIIAIIFGGVAWWPINNFLWTSKYQQIMAWLTLFLFLVVPLVGFITWIVRRMLRVKSRNNYLGWTFGGLWAIGWVVMILFVSSIAKDFRQQKNAEPVVVNVVQPANNKMIVAVSQPELEYDGRFGWMDDDGEGWNLSDDTLSISWVNFNVKPSTDSLYHVNVNKRSFGKSTEDAVRRAMKIEFNVVSRDSVLDIPSGFAIDKESKFRGQHVEVEIFVPVGKKIRFDESVRNKLNSVHLKVKRSSKRDRVVGVTVNDEEHRFRYDSNVDYTMGIDGELKDGSEPGPTNNNVSNPDTNQQTLPKLNKDSIDQEIQKIKLEQEEKERKIKELQKLKNQAKSTSMKLLPEPDNKTSVACSPSPIASLVEWF